MNEELLPIFEDPGDRPSIIAGPCSAESEEQLRETVRRLVWAGIRTIRAGVWKPRTKPGGFEGMGDSALEWLARIKSEFGVRTAVEVATPHHVHAALDAGADILWLGARTVTNPFAVQEIADALKGTDTAVLVKNPVNPDLELWIGALERIFNAGIRRLGAVHRGFSEYDRSIYRNTPQWRIPIELHRRLPSLPLYCDPSHIGGRRELIATLAQEAMDLGFDGLMVECHCDPDRALSDARQQITPERLAEIIDGLVIRDTARTSESLDALRREIDRVDTELLSLLAKRMRISREIAGFKREHGLSVLQAKRYDEMLSDRAAQGEELELDAEFVKSVLRTLHDESVRVQIQLINKKE